MATWSWVAQHRILMAIALVVGLLMVAALAVWFLLLRSPGNRIGLAQALQVYRRHRSSAEQAVADLPPDGVYRYRTSGGEQLSFAGISRSFPGATDMIVTGAGCTTMEWAPLEQHLEGMQECRDPGGGISATRLTTFESIAGTSTTTTIDCPADTYLVPPQPTVGERWRATCHSQGHAIGFSGTVLGTGTVRVGDQRVPALHTRLTWRFSGPQSGTNPNEYWVTTDGMVLEQHELVDITQSAGPLGSIRYTEHMSIRLESLAPIR